MVCNWSDAPGLVGGCPKDCKSQPSLTNATPSHKHSPSTTMSLTKGQVTCSPSRKKYTSINHLKKQIPLLVAMHEAPHRRNLNSIFSLDNLGSASWICHHTMAREQMLASFIRLAVGRSLDQMSILGSTVNLPLMPKKSLDGLSFVRTRHFFLFFYHSRAPNCEQPLASNPKTLDLTNDHFNSLWPIAYSK